LPAAPTSDGRGHGPQIIERYPDELWQVHLTGLAIAPADATGHFTWLGGFIGIDSPASSALTRELLGWQPSQPGLLDDLDKGHYFRSPST
jgi:hypothetical protein